MFLRRVNRWALRASRRLQLSYAWGYPDEIQLVPTNACTLRCMQCPKTWYETDNCHLRREVYDRVRDELYAHIRVLNLQGLGEPMLSPLFAEMVEDAERFGLKVRFVTNGMFMTREILSRLVRIGACVAVSLDGAVAATHEESRPGADYARILGMFEEFLGERRRQGETGFRIHLNTVVTTRNVDELDAILDIAGRYRIYGVSLINPGVGSRKDEFALAAIGRHPAKLAAMMPTLKSKALRLGIALDYPRFVDTISLERSGEDSPTSQTVLATHTAALKVTGARLFPGRCLGPWQTAYIDVDGWVRPCCRAIWVGMGNILSHPFRSIWNNEHYRRLREHINSNNPPAFCRDCNTQWGINCGNDLHVKTLEAAGIRLPAPPSIGITEIADTSAGAPPRPVPAVKGRLVTEEAGVIPHSHLSTS